MPFCQRPGTVPAKELLAMYSSQSCDRLPSEPQFGSVPADTALMRRHCCMVRYDVNEVQLLGADRAWGALTLCCPTTGMRWCQCEV